MGFDQYHEPPEELPAETRTFARLCASLEEEAQAIGWYQQRLAVEPDPEARAIMEDAQGEEFKHFSMDLEFLLRRTPRWRGITLLHEFSGMGIPVALANDNVGDPFFPYGDHDLLDTFRIATLTGQLDYPADRWPEAITTTPARIMGLDEKPFTPGAPADLILLPARSHAEMMSRSQHDRIVLRQGRAISRVLPDFHELDALMTPARTA